MDKYALIIEDDEGDRERIEDLLDARSIPYDVATDKVTAGRLLGKRDYAFVFLDMVLGPDAHAGDFLLNRIKHQNKPVPTVIVSRFASEASARGLPALYPFVVRTIDKGDLASSIPVIDADLDNIFGPPQEKEQPPRPITAAALTPRQVIAYAALLIGLLLSGVTGVLALWATFSQNPGWLNFVVAGVLFIIITATGALFGLERTRDVVSAFLKLLRRTKP